MNLDFKFIPPTDLGTVWDQVKPGLAAVRAKSNDSWREEDVYMSCKQGHSTFHIGTVDGEYAGFLVLTPTQSFDGPVLHIWLTYSEARDFCVFENGIEFIKECAVKMNAKRITFFSPRKGWERHGEKIGFKVRTTQFALEV